MSQKDKNNSIKLNKILEKIVDDSIRDLRKIIDYKKAKIEEIYIEDKQLLDMNFLTDSVVLGAVIAVKAYDYSLINEELARQWIKDMNSRIFKSLKEYMPNTTFKLNIRDKKKWEK